MRPPRPACGGHLTYGGTDAYCVLPEDHDGRCAAFVDGKPVHGSPEPSTRQRVLDEAARIVATDRNALYGPPEDNFAQIAGAINAIYARRLREPFTAADVASLMIIVKLSRQAYAAKEDNWTDIAGYAACGAECDAVRPFPGGVES